MPLISPLGIQLSGHTKTADASADQAAVIHALYHLLLDMGWTETEQSLELKAKGGIGYPLGFPSVVSSPIPNPTPVCCPSTPFLSLGGVQFDLYDPNTEKPVCFSCGWVPLDSNPKDNISALVQEINLQPPLPGVLYASVNDNFPDPPWGLKIFAAVYGPDSNYEEIIGDGRWGTSGGQFTGGGGYQLRSAPDAFTSQMTVTITASPGLIGGITFHFDFDNGGKADYTFHVANDRNGAPLFRGTIPNAFRLWANPYSFAIWDPTDPGSTNSLFAACPYRPPSEGFENVYSAFVLGPGSFWNQTFYANPVFTVALDGATQTFQGGTCPRLLALRSPGPPLLTRAGLPVVTGAYIEMGCSGQTPGIVGKIWDGAVISTPMRAAQIGTENFIGISAQDGSNAGTASSLLLRLPKPTASGAS